MNITDLIARVRRSAFLPTVSTDFTDAWICREINDQMTQLYERSVVKAQQGYWQQIAYFTLSPGKRQFRLPARACVGGVERIQIIENGTASGNEWFDLPVLEEADAIRYENSSQERPMRAVVRGEFIRVLPPVVSGTYYMRVFYAIRPSRITLPQTNPTTVGVVTSVDTTLRQVITTAAPDSIDEDGVKTALGTTNILIDIIRPSGWYSVMSTWTANRGANAFTLNAGNANLPETGDMSDIAVGDIVRASDQTDWPAIPQDFHRTIADAAAGKILTQRSMHGKATELMASHVVPDLTRFAEMLSPRVADQATAFVAPDFR